MQPTGIHFLIAVFEFVILIFSLCFHEAAHAWTASKLGDQTARMLGRVTLNPAYHVDPLGTLLIPALFLFAPLLGFGMFGGFLIGWAKPTPVTTRNFRNIRRDDTLTTLAGPLSNLLIAVLATLALAAIALFAPNGRIIALSPFEFLGTAASSPLIPLSVLFNLAIQVNISLAIFNMLPFPPLDGSQILRNYLPYNAAQQYDRLGNLSYLLMIVFGGRIVGLFMGPALGILYGILGRL